MVHDPLLCQGRQSAPTLLEQILFCDHIVAHVQAGCCPLVFIGACRVVGRQKDVNVLLKLFLPGQITVRTDTGQHKSREEPVKNILEPNHERDTHKVAARAVAFWVSFFVTDSIAPNAHKKFTCLT